LGQGIEGGLADEPFIDSVWSGEVKVINAAMTAESGATRTPIPAQGGQQSGDSGQQVMAA
jgi:hypothetical protein